MKPLACVADCVIGMRVHHRIVAGPNQGKGPSTGVISAIDNGGVHVDYTNGAHGWYTDDYLNGRHGRLFVLDENEEPRQSEERAIGFGT